MSDPEKHDGDPRPDWFADFERKLVDLIQQAPGSQGQDLGACLTVLIPRGAGADNAVFGGLVTARDAHRDQMSEELLRAVVWAMLADGVPPATLRATFDAALDVIAPEPTALDLIELDATEDDTVN